MQESEENQKQEIAKSKYIRAYNVANFVCHSGRHYPPRRNRSNGTAPLDKLRLQRRTATHLMFGHKTKKVWANTQCVGPNFFINYLPVVDAPVQCLTIAESITAPRGYAQGAQRRHPYPTSSWAAISSRLAFPASISTSVRAKTTVRPGPRPVTTLPSTTTASSVHRVAPSRYFSNPG